MTAAAWIACFACLAVVAQTAPGLGAEAFQIPARKPGCWEHTTVQGLFGKAGPGGSTYECVDAASEQARVQSPLPPDAGTCSVGSAPGSGVLLAWDRICTIGAVTDKLHMEAAGDFDSAYSMTIVSRTTKPGAAAQVSKVVANAKWISSACPANLPPGGWLLLGGEACTPEGSGN
jgi:hypothetical protein